LKRLVCGFAVVCALLVFSSVGLGNLVTANPIGYPIKSFPIVTINVNGTITPDADFLSRSGSTYTLKSNVSGYRINIECSDVVFDGDGHSMTLENNFMNPAIVAYQNYPTVVRNVTVKNVEVISPFTAINLINCAYCRITNVTASADIELGMSSNNVISKNACPLRIKSGVDNEVFMNNLTDLSLWTGPNVI
jgi:hypothetical protein